MRPVPARMMSFDSVLRCGSGRARRRTTPTSAPAKTQAKTITLTHTALMVTLRPTQRASSDRQGHRELHVESLTPSRELAAELPEVADCESTLERRELGSDAVDLRLVLPGDERSVDALR